MKIMLLGGAGFIGLNLGNALVKQGHEVHIVDRSDKLNNFGRQLPGIAGHHQIEIEDSVLLNRTVDELGVECIISLASSLIPSSTRNDFEEEMVHIITPTFRLLEHLARRHIRFVYLSSGGTVYGPNKKPNIRETEPLRPINYYGYSKVLFEQYLSFVGRTQQLRYMVLRPSNPFGPFQNPYNKQGLIAVAVDKVLASQPIEIWGDGSVVRDYIWVEDLANAITALISKEEAWGHTFNIGSGKGHSVRDLLMLIGELTGKIVDVQYRTARCVDVPRLVLDITRLRDIIDFEPLDLRSGLTLYLNGLH